MGDTAMVTYFDYEALGYCQYGVHDSSKPSGVSDCQEPALWRVWWTNDGELLMCQEHFDKVRESEEREIASRPPTRRE